MSIHFDLFMERLWDVTETIVTPPFLVHCSVTFFNEKGPASFFFVQVCCTRVPNALGLCNLILPVVAESCLRNSGRREAVLVKGSEIFATMTRLGPALVQGSPPPLSRKFMNETCTGWASSLWSGKKWESFNQNCNSAWCSNEAALLCTQQWCHRHYHVTIPTEKHPRQDLQLASNSNYWIAYTAVAPLISSCALKLFLG